jgi:hypothetical protein
MPNSVKCFTYLYIDINLTIKLFADDTSLYLIVDNPQEIAQTLKWLINFNPQKTETITISRKLNKPHRFLSDK